MYSFPVHVFILTNLEFRCMLATKFERDEHNVYAISFKGNKREALP